MESGPSLPSLSRIDFYRLHEGELIAALADAIGSHAERHPDAPPSPAQAAILAWARLAVDVPNGGFVQFFYNHRGDVGMAALADLLDSIDVPKAAAVLRDAVEAFHRNRSAFDVADPWDGLFGGLPEFDRLDGTFARVQLKVDRALEKWIRAHVAELASDEAGDPIDSQFTGVVEILQPNGLVGEFLEVKKGKPSGAYRTFFDDGTVRQVVFYKAGKVTGDFWPDGSLKRKESRRGAATIIEWFHPGGGLQKRYVKDKDGYAIEPVQLYHPNGQLAEEVHVHEGKRLGPWRKYFDDGSPRLEAEYTPDGRRVVRNAWSADRTQVVKDGAGVFHDDGLSLDVEHRILLEHLFQHDQELKDGVPNGKTTTYKGGVLWGVSSYKDGVRVGESTLYWDNGRLRSISKVVDEEEVETEFPKFDRPVPAVLLRVEANEKLYAAWGHMPVDEHPEALNLEEVRGRLVVPDFLREVHERNLAKATKSEYEDCSSFHDSIAYFLTVDEAGEVQSATANGSGVYSGGCWDVYPPLLRGLRFRPARVRGRVVESRVLVWVDHTFVEGDAS